jgi:hypothetical protein
MGQLRKHRGRQVDIARRQPFEHRLAAALTNLQVNTRCFPAQGAHQAG